MNRRKLAEVRIEDSGVWEVFSDHEWQVGDTISRKCDRLIRERKPLTARPKLQDHPAVKQETPASTIFPPERVIWIQEAQG